MKSGKKKITSVPQLFHSVSWSVLYYTCLSVCQNNMEFGVKLWEMSKESHVVLNMDLYVHLHCLKPGLEKSCVHRKVFKLKTQKPRELHFQSNLLDFVSFKMDTSHFIVLTCKKRLFKQPSQALSHGMR